MIVLSNRVLNIPKSQHIYAFNPDKQPVQQAKAKDVVVFDAEDAFGGQIESEQDTMDELDFDHINPATGPLAVEGAEPGDALVVKILDLKVGQKGIVLSVPGSGALAEEVPNSVTRIVEIKEDWIEFAPGIRLPKRPMLGVIGVAPSEGNIPCGTPGPHGGNMDTKEITAGTTLYLPVRTPGGLLAMGDAHALQGDGEICGTAVECSVSATVQVDIEKGSPIEWPWLRNDEKLMVIVSAETLDAASKQATRQMVRHLVDSCGMTFDEAYMLTSCVGSLNISQIVDPLVTVRAEFPRQYL